MRRALLAAGAALALAAPGADAQELLGAWPITPQGGPTYELMGGIATDAHGYVYVAVSRRGRILKYTSEGAFVRSFGDPPEESDLYDDDRPDEISSPEGLAVAPNGNLYVVESSSRTRVSVWTTAGRYVTAFADNGESDGQLSSPNGIAIDAQGFVYVADSGNNRVEKFTADGRFVRSIGTGAFTAEPDQLSDPQGVTVAPDGTLWVTDALYRRVQHYSADGAFLGTFGSNGSGDGQFGVPVGIAASSTALFVADRASSTVQRFGLDGTFAARLGSGVGSGPGQVSHPDHVAVDCSGTVYVADHDNRRVLRFGTPGAPPCGDPDPAERLRLVLRIARRQSFSTRFAVVAKAGCDRACTVTASGTVSLPGAKPVKLHRVRREQEAEGPLSLLLTLSEVDTDRVIAALRKGGRVTAKLTVTGVDARGERRTAKRSVRLSR